MSIILCSGENCPVDLGQPKAKSISCDYCRRWYCVDCSTVPKRIFDAINTSIKNKENVKMLQFVCKECDVSACKNCNASASSLKTIKQDIDTIKNDLNSVITGIDQNSNEIKLHIDNKITENVNDIKDECNKGYQQTFADMVSKWDKLNIPSAENISTGVKKVIDNSSLAIKEQELRDRSFMIYNREEQSAATFKDRTEADKQFITEFVAALQISPVEIESIVRIGKYEDSPDKTNKRPMKVTLVTRSDQVKVLQNLLNLKHADPVFKSCFITIDRNDKQRSEIRDLVQEAKQKTEASTDSYFLVRGNPYRPAIVELRKTNAM